MKFKSLLALPLLATVFTVAGCQKGYYTIENGTSVYVIQQNKYQLDVDVDIYADYCRNLPESKKYLEGDLITFEIVNTDRVDIRPYLNNRYLESKEFKDGFLYFEFRMPSRESTLDISSHFFGKEASLKEIVPEIANLEEEDIKGVRVSTGQFRVSWGPDGDASPTDRYSEDSRDISYNYQILVLKQLRKTGSLSTDYGPYTKVTFTLKDKMQISFTYENYVIECYDDYGDIVYYEFLDTNNLPKIQYPSNI